MVPGPKGAAAADVSDHSLLLCSSSSSPSEEEEGVYFSLTRHPFISLLIPLSLCVCCRTLATEVNIHDFGVCFPPSGFTIASMIAPLTTSWYFFYFKSLPKIRFKSVGAENHSRLPCTTHRTSILKSSAMLKILPPAWKIVLDDTHS